MSKRIVEFFICNLCGVEKQGPQNWKCYGVADLTDIHRCENEYRYKIHICHDCYKKEVPSTQQKIVNWLMNRLRIGG